VTAPVDLTRPGLSVHVVGIGGAGMSAIATVLVAMGHRVTGSDLKPSPGLERLRALGVEVFVGHGAEQVGDVDVVTCSTAVPATNPELVAAGERGIPVLRRADMLAAITAVRRTVAVAGTHGKTTTSSMLALVLTEAGLAPSYLIGGDLNQAGGGAVWTDGDLLVVEADESDGTFLELGADAVVVTSVEPDHLDFYGTFDAIEDAFDRFLADAPGAKAVCADDPVAFELGTRHGAESFGIDDRATYRMVDIETGRTSTRFGLEHGGARLGEVEVPVPGVHNARNAAAAITMGLALGAPLDAAIRAIARYGGVARRFEFRGERDGITYVDDYAHNPGKIKAVLAAARAGGWSRVVCVFQPHLYSRTVDLLAGYADAFVDADLVVITDVYGAREAPRPGVSGLLVVRAVLDAHPQTQMAYMPTRADIIEYLHRRLRPGDLCLTLGAGDLTTLPDELLGTVPGAADD
jgi:UDP-N-acetylmuramate--alanine ligase